MNTIDELDALPGQLPPNVISEKLKVPPPECSAFVQKALTSLDSATVIDDVLWRDIFCFTGSSHTLHGADDVLRNWQNGFARKGARDFVVIGAGRISRHLPAHSWIDVPFFFTIECTPGLRAKCSGNVSLIPKDDTWQIWLITTVLEHFANLNSPDVPPTPKDTDLFQISKTAEVFVPVAIVGAGHSGLSLAGRLNALGVECLVMDKGATFGSSWTEDKYDCVRLHTIREMNHLPFSRTYSADEPKYLPAANVAAGFERFAKSFVPNVWLSTTVESCKRNSTTQIWTIYARRDGEMREICARHLCIATGGSGMAPHTPRFPGMVDFRGEILHTASYRNSKAWSGSRAVIIGTGTSAHDVAEDMVQANLKSVTMVQRGKTAVFPAEWMDMGSAAIYNTAIPTEVADRANALPFKIARSIIQTPTQLLTRKHPELFDGLECAGFHVDRRLGLVDLTIMRAGGYYIDFGTSSRIVRGEIKVKSGSPVSHFTRDSIVFEDGQRIPADVVVIATGYVHDYPKLLASMIGDDLANEAAKVGFWGFDREGEQKGVMKPVAPGLWLQAGGPMHARWFSRFTALQIQADLLGHQFQDTMI